MRLTKTMRDNILTKAVANVPTIDYHVLLTPVIQDVLCKHMPPDVRKAYDDPGQRVYLNTVTMEVRKGNQPMYIRGEDNRWHDFCGIPTTGPGRCTIRVDDGALDRLRKGTLDYDLAKAVIDSGYYDKHYEQEQLFADVKRRLKATLDSVSTLKRLYDVLEPELHHLIPKEEDKAANLPAAAAPVVDDLRKLGAQLPTIPKKA